MVFLENTAHVNSSSWGIDSVEYNLAFRGIQSIPGNISKRQRDEIFNRVLRILTSKQLPPSDTMIADYINLLTRYVEHISQPLILLDAGLGHVDEVYREGNITDQVPLITVANILDFGQGIKINLAAALALKHLAEVTIQ